MKKTNALTSMVASLFISTAATATVPTTELVKADPIQLANLSVVQEALTNSLSTLKLKTDYTESIKMHTITLQKKQANQNKTLKIASNEVIAD